jgi:hypothetical protein
MEWPGKDWWSDLAAGLLRSRECARASRPRLSCLGAPAGWTDGGGMEWPRGRSGATLGFEADFVGGGLAQEVWWVDFIRRQNMRTASM